MLPAMPERLNRVTIALPKETVEIPWDSRDALLREIRYLSSAAELIAAFEAVGASQPVRLTAEQRGELHRLTDEWARRAGGKTYLPEGIWALHSALAYE